MELTQSKFFFDMPIYSPVNICESNWDIFSKIVKSSPDVDFEGYNPWRKFESTFKSKSNVDYFNDTYTKDGGYRTIVVTCKRSGDHFEFYIYWNPERKCLLKIGQYPSVADFHISEIKQYKKLLSSEKMKEFTRAIKLAANGVGIGSFVYLRRIFEHLIADAYEAYKNDKHVSEDELVNKEEFKRFRMDDKINVLSGHLPEFLVQNKSIYSILSQGIHELDESACLKYFDTLKDSIEIILDEKLNKLSKEEKIKMARKNLNQIKK